MKKILTFLFLSVCAFAMNAQTIILSQDFEGTGTPFGWTQQTAATDGGFKFGAASVLSSSSFPVPDNGGKAAGTNDDGCNCNKSNDMLIMPSFDFTTAPAVSLKFDLFYYDASYQSIQEHAYVSVSQNFGLWEDVATLSGAGDWQVGYTVDLSAYAGMNNVRIAFRYSDGGGWLYGMAIDNVTVFTPADHDVSVTKTQVPRFKEAGSTVDIAGEISNFGSETLTSVDISWSDGTNTYTDNITGIDVPYLGTYNFVLSTPLSLTNAVSYNYTVWAENPNGAPDADDTNNQQAGVVSGVSYIPSKKMVSEEATGTWCGWCPRGTEWMDFMAENYPDDFIGIAVHNADPMTVTAYDNGLNNFPGFSGYPSVIIDRNAIWDPSDMEDILPDYLARIAPIAPELTSASIDVATRTLTVGASAEFVTQLDNIDYRFNVVLTEDDVTGTGSGYAQTNYYSGPAAPTDPIPGYGSDWDALPSPVPAADMVYNHVGRALLGGWAGTASSIPAAVVAGDVAQKEYTVTNFNTDWNPYNMHAVVMIIDNASGEILNANSAQIDVICPASFGAEVTVTPSSNGGNGAIDLTPPSSTYGFGGYTYAWSNGETTPSLANLAPGTYTLSITDKIGCSQSIDVEVENTSNVEDIASLTSFTLTPNPASSVSVLTASFAQAVDANVQMVNLEGKVVASASFGTTTSVNHTFDLSDIATGMYMVKMTVGNQVHTERLMVSK